MQGDVILTLGECTAWVRVIIMIIRPSRITKIYNHLKAQAFLFPEIFSRPWWRHSLGSNNSSPLPHAVAWQRTLGPSDGQKPGAQCWAVGGIRPVGCCGWLTEVLRIFAEVWRVILGVDWQVNIQTVQVYRWTVKGLAKGFFIRWWRLPWNVTKEILWCDLSKDARPDCGHKYQFTSYSKYCSFCVNSCVVTTGALEELSEVWENKRENSLTFCLLFVYI